MPVEFRFSRTLRAVVAVSCRVKDTGPQKRKAGTAIHSSLQHLQPVDLALSRAGRPWQIKSRLHRSEIAPHAYGKCFERRASRVVEYRVQTFLARPAQPLV